MEERRIREILEGISNVNIAVYGDFCLDAYWILDKQGSEVSVETGLQAQAVAKHYYSLGGASNVVANIAALKPAGIRVIGTVGDDIFGRELVRQMHALGVDTNYLVVQKENFDTVTFGKPYLDGTEKPRIDFGFFNKRSEKTDKLLLEGIEKALQTADVLIFNQQVPGSITNEAFIKQVNSLFDRFPDKIVLLDTRHYGDKFRNIYRKTNDLEAARLNGVDVNSNGMVSLKNVKKYAKALFEKSRKPVFVTCGAMGIIVVDSKGEHEIPAIQILKEIDTVGAGDTVTSALALCLGAKMSPRVEPAEAAEFANLAAAVTIQKLFQTGTASAEEVLNVGKDPDYIYNSELAGDIRQARYYDNTEIELCSGEIPLGRIKHAVFDHDGTISTLRQGWEQVMAPVMIKAILGDKYKTADSALYNKVHRRVINYIDKSTGIQTILQMEALVEMVKEFGFVKPENILDKFGYKEIYNDALMEIVNKRIDKFKNGELDIDDYTLKGSVEFVKFLYDRGVKLYLASGTDRKDVINESNALGYAGLFEGGIYGAVGDVSKYSKKMVIDKILMENKLHGSELAVFGDGPVELRECVKRDGITIGVASDEIRRHGLSVEKRARLIKAGAQIIIPDFSQYNKLVKFLFQQ